MHLLTPKINKLSILIAAAIADLFLPMVATAQDSGNVQRKPSVEAVFADTAPRIDGHLDDAIWDSIEPIRGFVQRWPDEGADPRQILGEQLRNRGVLAEGCLLQQSLSLPIHGGRF